ncbi:MAG: hypothetical protein ACRCXC_11295 [Legionella sp.]
MTFGLKELSALKSDFDYAVDVRLKRDHIGKIEDMKNPVRKYELQFLASILAKLVESVKAKAPLKKHQEVSLKSKKHLRKNKHNLRIDSILRCHAHHKAIHCR